MFPLLLLGLAIAAPPPVHLAVPGLSVVHVEGDLAAFYTEHLASELVRAGVDVVTSRQLEALLGLERQKALLGCEAADGCVAEIAGALGVDGIVVGQVGRLDTVIQLDLRVISPRDASPLATWSGRASTDEELLDLLAAAAQALARDLTTKLRPRAAAAPEPFPTAWVLPSAIAGGVLLTTGGVLLSFAARDHAWLTVPTAPTLSPADSQHYRDQGARLQMLGLTSLGVGAVAITAAVLAYALAPEDTFDLTLAAAPHDLTVFASARF